MIALAFAGPKPFTTSSSDCVAVSTAHGHTAGVGDVVKLDCGARFDGYHDDMTRTVDFGEPPVELREIYDLLRRAQLAGQHRRRGRGRSEDDHGPAEDAVHQHALLAFRGRPQ